ncbi:Conserved hypothetical protein [Methylocystis sp. SC2]|nr:Conserved hypothetical protein [Methylocystis sp. SC2]
MSREGLLGFVAAGYGVTIASKAARGVAFQALFFGGLERRTRLSPFRMAWVARNDNPAMVDSSFMFAKS